MVTICFQRSGENAVNGDAAIVGNVGNCVGNVGNRVGNLRQQGALTARVALAAYGKLSVDDSQARCVIISVRAEGADMPTGETKTRQLRQGSCRGRNT